MGIHAAGLASSFNGSSPSSDPSNICSPLRERTATTLCLNIKDRDILPMRTKGHLEPWAHNLPRRRKASDQTAHKVSETTARGACASRNVDTHYTVEQDETCLQELVPNLFVAFADKGHNL